MQKKDFTERVTVYTAAAGGACAEEHIYGLVKQRTGLLFIETGHNINGYIMKKGFCLFLTPFCSEIIISMEMYTDWADEMYICRQAKAEPL